MKILSTWKLLRTTRRIRTQPVRPPHIPSIANMQLSPFGSFVRKRETPGLLSRMFPSFVGITYYRVRAYLAPCIASLCFVMLCLLRIYCFFPLFFSGRPRDRCWCHRVRLRHRRPFVLYNRAPRQAPPPLITKDHLFFSIQLALE